jgi:8-oxo-dGTP diphosphatase
MKRIVVVAGLIYCQKTNRLLISQRYDKGHELLRSRWEFPGGKIESGEHPFDALKRELKEEIDVEVENGSPIEIIHSTSLGIDIIMICYLITKWTGEPKPVDVADIAWKPINQLNQYDFVDADKPFVEKLVARAKAGDDLWLSDALR